MAGSLSRLDEDRLEELPLRELLEARRALLDDDEEDEGRELLEELEEGRLLLDEELDGGRRLLEELLGSRDDDDLLRELELLDEDEDFELELRLLEDPRSTSGGGLALIATMCAT